MKEKIVVEDDIKKKTQGDEDNGDEDDEHLDLMFKVCLEKTEPPEIKVSKKNVCIVTIVDDSELNE